MIQIMFICHGNICRSPMAEFVMKDMIKKAGLEKEISVSSCATSTEEIGNPVHPGTRNKLKQVGLPTDGKYAVQLKKSDYDQYDLLIAMDAMNIRNILRIIGKDDQNKVCKLLDFAGKNRDIADPWYTGNFDDTYRDVVLGCEALLRELQKRIRQ